METVSQGGPADPVRVLVVEDSENDTTLLVNELRVAGLNPDWKRVETETDYRVNLAGHPDVIFCDYNMPKFSMTRALSLLQETKFDIPFIIVSGTIDESAVVKCLKAGATDYVSKNHFSRLEPVVRRALREVRERAGHKQLEEEFRRAQKMESLGQPSGGVTSLTSLLAVIRGHASLLLANGALDAKARQSVEEISFTAERAAKLAAQLSGSTGK